MTTLGRRKHLRFLLAQPVEGNLRVREEVTIESLTDREAVILSCEPCRASERFTLEVSGPLHRRLNVMVAECRPAVVSDGAIRHRCRLTIDGHEPGQAPSEGCEP